MQQKMQEYALGNNAHRLKAFSNRQHLGVDLFLPLSKKKLLASCTTARCRHVE